MKKLISYFLLLFTFATYGSELHQVQLRGIQVIGQRAHIDKFLRLVKEIESTNTGRQLLENLSTKKAFFKLENWSEANSINRKIDHTRHAVWQEDEGYKFSIIFSPDEPEDRVLDFYHPGNFDVEGKVILVHALYRQLLKSSVILDLNSLNYSQNYLIWKTLKFAQELDSDLHQ